MYITYAIVSGGTAEDTVPLGTIAAQSGYDVPLMKSNGLKQYFPKGWN